MAMSALFPKVDVCGANHHVSQGPKTDITSVSGLGVLQSFAYLVYTEKRTMGRSARR